MELDAKFDELYDELKKLQDALFATRLTVSEDKPSYDEAALADDLFEILLEVMGSVDGCLTTSIATRQAVEHPVDLEAARHSLSACQERFREAEQMFTAKVLGPKTLRELAHVATQRGGEWRPWAKSVRQGIATCRAHFSEVSKALGACWEKIAERVGTTNITVRTTNIGQHITGAKSEVDELEIEGVT